MEINDFLGIVVVGALLSAVVQWLKNKFGTQPGMTRILTIVLALVIGGGYVWIRSTSYYQTVILVLTTASAVYALLIKPLEA